MRVVIVLLIMLAMALSLFAPVAGAQSSIGFSGGPVSIGIPYVVGPGFTVAAPFAQGSVFLQAFNTSMLAHDYAGSLAIAFPPADTGGFGFPVFAGPAIAQTTSESIVATQSYFFNDFIT
jgi:hypothetical protein